MTLKRQNYQKANRLEYIRDGLVALRKRLILRQSLLISNYASFGPEEDQPLEKEIRFLSEDLIPCIEKMIAREGGG